EPVDEHHPLDAVDAGRPVVPLRTFVDLPRVRAGRQGWQRVTVVQPCEQHGRIIVERALHNVLLNRDFRRCGGQQGHNLPHNPNANVPSEMALQDTEADRAFRQEVRDWLAENLVGEFAELGSRGGPGREHEGFEVRQAWERKLGAAGWTCLGWPTEHGGREATLEQQVAFHEEYARAGAPARLGHIGEGLIGPTIIEFGTPEQKARFLPPIRTGDELWCQGYSEPDAGSDLANVKTRAELDGGEWVITGQKVWTSLATWADWVFVLCRTDPSVPKHKGLSYLLVPMDQPGIEVRPIVQRTGTSEFNEVFFDGARTFAG